MFSHHLREREGEGGRREEGGRGRREERGGRERRERLVYTYRIKLLVKEL